MGATRRDVNPRHGQDCPPSGRDTPRKASSPASGWVSRSGLVAPTPLRFLRSIEGDLVHAGSGERRGGIVGVGGQSQLSSIGVAHRSWRYNGRRPASAAHSGCSRRRHRPSVLPDRASSSSPRTTRRRTSSGCSTTSRAPELFRPGSRIIVVDDGSADDAVSSSPGTTAPMRHRARIALERNQGPGAAFRAGFAAALDGCPDDALHRHARGRHDERPRRAARDARARRRRSRSRARLVDG